MRLIDENTVLDIIRDYFVGLTDKIAEEYGADEIPMGVINPYLEMNKALRTMVRQIPTVDAEPVVRCKDCIYYHKGDWYDDDVCKVHSNNDRGYCAWGERK